MWCLLLTFPELFQLVVAYEFHVLYQGPLVIKQLMQMSSYHGVWPGWAVSVSVLPLTAVCKINARNRKVDVTWGGLSLL